MYEPFMYELIAGSKRETISKETQKLFLFSLCC